MYLADINGQRDQLEGRLQKALWLRKRTKPAKDVDDWFFDAAVSSTFLAN